MSGCKHCEYFLGINSHTEKTLDGKTSVRVKYRECYVLGSFKVAGRREPADCKFFQVRYPVGGTEPKIMHNGRV